MRTVWRAEELRRLPLGTMYTTVVEEVARVVRRPEMEGRCTVVADATGVGMPVMEMLRRSRMRAGLTPVILTGTSGPAHCTDGVWQVGRRESLTGLREMLEGRRVMCSWIIRSRARRSRRSMRTVLTPFATRPIVGTERILASSRSCRQSGNGPGRPKR